MTKNSLKIHDSIMKQYVKKFKHQKNFKESLNKLSLVQKAFVLKHVSPQSYYPWDRFAKDIIWQINTIKTPLKKNKDKTKWLAAPAYYLTKELAEAFIRTPVDNIKLEEKPNIVNQSFIIFQPTELNSTNYTLVEFITIPPKPQGPSVPFQKRQESSELISIKSKGKFSKEKTHLSERFSLDPRFYKRLIKNYKNYPTEKQEQINIVINMILFMNQKPDIEIEEEEITPINRSFQKEYEFKTRAITWIGKNFTQRIIKPKAKTEELIIKQKGTPVRSHWRRGHWHTICQGPKRRKRKLKWYLPIFVTGRGVI